jgi:hypothetical protein
MHWKILLAKVPILGTFKIFSYLIYSALKKNKKKTLKALFKKQVFINFF